MIDPTRDDPLDHLVLSFATGRYTVRGGSRAGAATLRVLPRLGSDPLLSRGRLFAVAKLREFLKDYDEHHAAGRIKDAHRIREALVHEPFSAVFAAVLRASAEPGATDVLGKELVDLVSHHPALHDWLAEADRSRVANARSEIETLARAVRVPQRIKRKTP